MALVNSSGYAHVRLTVTDIGRSASFYDQVFGWPKAIDATDSANDPGVEDSPEKFYGGVVYQTPQGTLFGLRPVGSDQFDSVPAPVFKHCSITRTGTHRTIQLPESLNQVGPDVAAGSKYQHQPRRT